MVIDIRKPMIHIIKFNKVIFGKFAYLNEEVFFFAGKFSIGKP